MNELRADTSQSQVAFSSIKLVYPGNSRTETVSSSTFKVPIYEVEGATAFTLIVFLIFTNNGVVKEE